MKRYRVFFLGSDIGVKSLEAQREEADKIQDFLNSQAEQGWFLKEISPYFMGSGAWDLLIILEKKSQS